MNIIHNTKIYVNESNYENQLLKSINTRSNYLDNNDIKNINNKIKQKELMLFLGNDISESLIFENYKLIMHGILPCGSKTTLIINKIYPYVDIEYNSDLSEEENIEYLKTLFKNEKLINMLKGKSVDFKKINIVKGKKFMYFNENESKFIRIKFNKLYHRICFIRLLNKLNIISYNNDINNYYRVVSRTYKINLSSWNIVKNYSIERNSKYKSEYVLSIDIKDIIQYSDELYNKYFTDIDIDLIRKDKSISMSFDIEQYSSNFNPERPDIVILPSGKIKEDEIFNIGLTYQFIHEKNSFLNIALLTKEANEHEDYLTIICSNEKVLLKVFGYINSLLQPDFIMEFNGSEFDWINIYEKCLYYKIIENLCENLSIKKLSNYELKIENISKYIYSIDSIKIFLLIVINIIK
jgi:DNA polymerase elongation subunit (family B)